MPRVRTHRGGQGLRVRGQSPPRVIGSRLGAPLEQLRKLNVHTFRDNLQPLNGGQHSLVQRFSMGLDPKLVTIQRPDSCQSVRSRGWVD